MFWGIKSRKIFWPAGAGLSPLRRLKAGEAKISPKGIKVLRFMGTPLRGGASARSTGTSAATADARDIYSLTLWKFSNLQQRVNTCAPSICHSHRRVSLWQAVPIADKSKAPGGAGKRA